MSVFYFVETIFGIKFLGVKFSDGTEKVLPEVEKITYLFSALMIRHPFPAVRELQDELFWDFPKEDHEIFSIFKLGHLCTGRQIHFLSQVKELCGSWIAMLKDENSSFAQDLKDLIRETDMLIECVSKYGSYADVCKGAIEGKKQQLKDYKKRYKFLKTQQARGMGVPQSELDYLKKEIEYLEEAIRKLKKSPHEITMKKVKEIKTMLGIDK